MSFLTVTVLETTPMATLPCLLTSNEFSPLAGPLFSAVLEIGLRWHVVSSASLLHSCLAFLGLFVQICFTAGVCTPSVGCLAPGLCFHCLWFVTLMHDVVVNSPLRQGNSGFCVWKTDSLSAFLGLTFPSSHHGNFSHVFCHDDRRDRCLFWSNKNSFFSKHVQAAAALHENNFVNNSDPLDLRRRLFYSFVMRKEDFFMLESKNVWITRQDFLDWTRAPTQVATAVTTDKWQFLEHSPPGMLPTQWHCHQLQVSPVDTNLSG